LSQTDAILIPPAAFTISGGGGRAP